MDHIRRVIIGLGSNLGDRAKNIDDALGRLRADADLHVRATSRFYETDPVGGPPQDRYVNGAVLVLTSLDASTLLDRLLAIEIALGRQRTERDAPRTIDLDILWIEGEIFRSDRLHVPHSRLAERAFALVPLVELAPDARDEGGGLYADLALARTPLDPAE